MYWIKVVLMRLGIHLFVNKERWGGNPQFFIRTLRCHIHVRLKFCSFEFIKWASLKAVFLHFKIMVIFYRAENQDVEDGSHQISIKINEKSWRNFKIIQTSYQIVIFITMMLKVFINNLI
jgi:hypothetical protein